MDELLEILKLSIQKNGDKVLTTTHLKNIVAMAIRARDEAENERDEIHDRRPWEFE